MASSVVFLFLILACPLLMWLMMRGGHGHGHGHGHGSHGAPTVDGHHGDAPTTDDLRRRRAELDREITARERVDASMTMLQALRRSRPASPVTPTHIRVHGGYHPDTVHARVGEPVRLTFRREETAPCSERVVFPDFGKSAMLPAHQDVTIELTPERSGSYEFTCQMGMLRGTLIVAGETAEQLGQAQLGATE